MADVLLSCAETPMAWPPSVALSDVTISTTSQLHLFAPTAGPLQILTRRQSGGVGDGVNIEESPSVGADYRGQRYALEEVIFHTPGLHTFPGETAPYPAELHIHMRTVSAPQRAITIVIPASHKVPEGGPSLAYFAACAAKPDPSAKRPTLLSVLVPGTDVLIVRGPDLRGRTADDPSPPMQCAPDALQREFLLVLNPVYIRASDLERIPREGSLSTNPRDLPASGVTAPQKIPRDRLLRCAILARPGLTPLEIEPHGPLAAAPKPAGESKELECRPLKVVNGRDVIDVDGKPVDLAKLLGFEKEENRKDVGQAAPAQNGQPAWVQAALMFIGTMIGLLIADWIFGNVWGLCFHPSYGRLYEWEPLKIVIFVSVAMVAAGFSDTPMSMLQGWTSSAPPLPTTDASGNPLPGLTDASGNALPDSGS